MRTMLPVRAICSRTPRRPLTRAAGLAITLALPRCHSPPRRPPQRRRSRSPPSTSTRSDRRGRRLVIVVGIYGSRTHPAPGRARQRRSAADPPRCTSWTISRSCATPSRGTRRLAERCALQPGAPHRLRHRRARSVGPRRRQPHHVRRHRLPGDGRRHRGAVRHGRLHRGLRSRCRPVRPSSRRRVAAALQAKLTLQHVGSNVTLVGALGDEARVVGASPRIRDAHNVIVRNLTLSDAHDCFLQADAGDAGGNWNSAHDNLSVWTSTSVWVDHNTFDDGAHPATSLDTVYGRPLEVHDALDVTRRLDLVTMSNSAPGITTRPTSSARPTRAPRTAGTASRSHSQPLTDIASSPCVRFGDVHVYNNLYEQTDATTAASSATTRSSSTSGAGKEQHRRRGANAVESTWSSASSIIRRGGSGRNRAASGHAGRRRTARRAEAAYNATAASPPLP